MGRHRSPSPSPVGSSTVAAYSLHRGEEVWRLPVPQMSDSNDAIRLVVVDEQLVLINGGEWIAALE